MEKQLLSRIIKDMLREAGYAPLPLFGVFRTEVAPACFSDRGFTINPPYLKVVFNVEENTDNRLAKCYAQANGISQGQAERIVAEAVEDLKGRVNEDKVADLPGLGKLRATRDGIVFFVMAQDLAISPAFDLLSPVSLKSLDDVEAPSGSQPEPQQPAPEAAPIQAESESTQPASQQPEPQPVPAQPQPLPLAMPGKGRKSKYSGRNKVPGLTLALIIVLILAALFFGALALAGRLCPELVDWFLYSPQELEILNYKL